ncbi:hypothetical protein FHG87_007282 [Trinorchestia longiramus]|nr:hypothetical protein FHG87_007282 [Trinorchestia longiramus]
MLSPFKLSTPHHQLGRLVSESACEREDPSSNPAAEMVDAARNTAWDLAQRLFGAAMQTSSIDKDQVLRETFDKVQTLQQKNVFLLVDEVQIRPTVSISSGLLSGMAENNRDCKATSILITRQLQCPSQASS